MTTRFLVGDVFDGLATIPDNSVDLIISSPPFLALRSYLPADHPDKGLEIGSEATPGAFLDKLLDVVEECARVLAPHGSLVFELGDTYAAEEGQRKPDADGARDKSRWLRGERTGGVERPASGAGPGWPMAKSKVLVPQLFAIALAYGFNPLTGRTTEPWRVRNTVAWCRPNPPVGRDGDKFRPATSFLTVATKVRDRYWDGDAVRQINHPERMDERAPLRKGTPGGTDARRLAEGETYSMSDWNPAGAPLLDYWVIPTEPYSGSHYATFPRALVVPLVKSMCPQKVCRVCGEPSRRIVAPSERYAERMGKSIRSDNDNGLAASKDRNSLQPTGMIAGEYETLGWSDCGHDDWRAGVVLDCFAGSGTTLAVASGHGLDSIGIDLDARNSELAAERVGGLFLEITEIRGAVA